MAQSDTTSDYLLQPYIFRPISVALCQLYKAHPKNPVDYLGQLLLGLSKKQSIIEEDKKRKELAKDEEIAYKALLDAKAKAEQEEASRKHKEQKKHESFVELMHSTDNFKDIMEQLCEYVKELTSATGVYIGELTTLRKPITDDDITVPPVDESAPQIIKYIATSEDHAFMKKLYLEANKGITFNALKTKEDEVKEDDKEVKEGDPPKKVITDEEKAKKQIIFVKEVLREEKMNYFVVPRLGSYLAIPLMHKSCLTDAILEAAINDFLLYKQKLEDQEKAKKEFEEKVAEESAKAAENGTEYKAPEPPKYEEVKLAPYQNVLHNFVLCIDTLGQDRVFSEQQIDGSFSLAWLFKTMWDAKEEALLSSDKERRIKERADIKDYSEKELPKVFEEEKSYISTKNAEDPAEDKEFMEKFHKFTFLTQQITKGYPSDILKQYANYHVCKYPQIFLSLFYLLGISRTEVCFDNTNTLNWRVARELINSKLLQKIGEYKVRGAKEQAPPKYMMINKILPLVADLKEEEVEVNYYLLAQLLRWIRGAVEIRLEDIKRRKAKYQQMMDARSNQEKQNEEIKKERDDALAKAREEAKNSVKPVEPKEGEDQPAVQEPKFDEEAFLKEWDTAHPTISVEELPKPDKDADYEE